MTEEAHGHDISLHLFFSGNPVAQTDAMPRIFVKEQGLLVSPLVFRFAGRIQEHW
ncbi:hypothetical protein MYAER_3731 [Microcystis aeruginosa NIES-2549]|uniref:Uncharacterized protein n=1 Tax=Microcystis aeruginosa NIES-2549 TaxID=1641812 RepID=A0A0F6RNC8_MICAE|nr:hypothetical protein MYAER_3731 [Microcystis aeruginosa NIES-2549]